MVLWTTKRESEEKTIGREEIYVGVVASHHTVYIFLVFVFVLCPIPLSLAGLLVLLTSSSTWRLLAATHVTPSPLYCRWVSHE